MLRFLNYKIVGNRLIFLNRKVRLEKIFTKNYIVWLIQREESLKCLQKCFFLSYIIKTLKLIIINKHICTYSHFNSNM